MRSYFKFPSSVQLLFAAATRAVCACAEVNASTVSLLTCAANSVPEARGEPLTCELHFCIDSCTCGIWTGPLLPPRPSAARPV